jgi:uncharacterized damage-inducible protein DinB
MSISESLLQELQQEGPSTRRVLERLPADAWDWRPHAKSMTTGELASHVSQIPDWMVAVLTTDDFTLNTADYTPWVAADPAELLRAFDERMANFKGALEGKPDDYLIGLWRMVMDGREVFNLPRAAVIRSMGLNHLVHHRAQLALYLRLRDVPVPAIYGPSADEQA